MFDLNSVQLDDGDGEGSDFEHSEIPIRPRTSLDGFNYDNRSQFFTQQQQQLFLRRAIHSGAFPPHYRSDTGAQRTTGTMATPSHGANEDFYRGITENSDLQSLINPSNAIGGEMLAIKQHQRNLSNSAGLFNSNANVTNFSRISPLDEDDTATSTTGNATSHSSASSGSNSPMVNRKDGNVNNFGNADYDDNQMRASRSSLDSSIQRWNFIQNYNAITRGNPNYFSLIRGTNAIDGGLKMHGYIQQQQQQQHYGSVRNIQQCCHQQQIFQSYNNSSNNKSYKGNGINSFGGSNGYRWGNAYSVPLTSLNSSGVNSPCYYDSYHSSGYTSSLSGSTSSVMSEQSEVMDDPRELQKIKEDIDRNNVNNLINDSNIDDDDDDDDSNDNEINEVSLFDNTYLENKITHPLKTSQFSSSSSSKITSSLTNLHSSSSSSSSLTTTTMPLSSSSTVTSISTLTSTSNQKEQSIPATTTSSPGSLSPSSSTLSPQRKYQNVKKKLDIQKPKSKIIQQSPLSQNNNNNNNVNGNNNNNNNSNNNNNNELNPQQQFQKKKRRHRGGRRGTRVMREARERKMASLREAKLLADDETKTDLKTDFNNNVNNNNNNNDNDNEYEYNDE